MTDETEMTLRIALGGEQLTVGQAADLLAVSSTTVKRMIYARELQAARIGGDWRIGADELIAYRTSRMNANPNGKDAHHGKQD